MESLQLDFGDILVDFCIDEYVKDDWCKITIKVNSENLSYCVENDPMLETSDLEWIVDDFTKFLNGDIKETKIISFIEPFIEFELNPIRHLRDNNSCIEWKIFLWEKTGGLTDSYIGLCMYRQDIEKMVDYLQRIILLNN